MLFVKCVPVLTLDMLRIAEYSHTVLLPTWPNSDYVSAAVFSFI